MLRFLKSPIRAGKSYYPPTHSFPFQIMEILVKMLIYSNGVQKWIRAKVNVSQCCWVGTQRAKPLKLWITLLELLTLSFAEKTTQILLKDEHSWTSQVYLISKHLAWEKQGVTGFSKAAREIKKCLQNSAVWNDVNIKQFGFGLRHDREMIQKVQERKWWYQKVCKVIFLSPCKCA
jgi:hypothetical protein